MGIHENGIKAEINAHQWLINKGLKNLQQIDWLVKNSDGKYFCVESKARELFEPPPFWGTGLDKRQLFLRKQLLTDLNIDTILLVFEKHTHNIYWQFLSILEESNYFDTRKGIRIYPLTSFHKETI